MGATPPTCRKARGATRGKETRTWFAITGRTSKRLYVVARRRALVQLKTGRETTPKLVDTINTGDQRWTRCPVGTPSSRRTDLVSEKLPEKLQKPARKSTAAAKGAASKAGAETMEHPKDESVLGFKGAKKRTPGTSSSQKRDFVGFWQVE